MAVYKDGDKWRVVFRFSNWMGERKQTQKRGFTTKREALMWEREELLKQGSKLDMTFESFFEIYANDKKQRVKENTWESKELVIRRKILPALCIAFRFSSACAFCSRNNFKTSFGIE